MSKRPQSLDPRTTTLLVDAMDRLAYAVVLSEFDGTVVFLNSTAERMFGYSAEELIGRQSPLLWHDPEEVQRRAAELSVELGVEIPPGPRVFTEEARRGVVKTNEWTAIRKDGTRIPILLSVSALVAPDGDVWGFLGVANDVSARKRAESALRLSEERFALALKGTNDGIWDWDIRTDQIWFSTRFKELLGYRDEEFPDTLPTFKEHLHPDERKMVLRRINQHVQRLGPLDIECRMQNQDGSYRWYRIRGQGSWEESGSPLRVVGAIADVTARRRTLEDLKRNDAHLRGILESALDAILTVTEAGVVELLNPATERMFGYSRDEALNQSIEMLLPEISDHVESGLSTAEVIEEHFLGVTRETVGRRKDGTPVLGAVSFAEVLGAGGRFFTCIFHDLTKRAEYEEELRLAKEAAEDANLVKSRFLAKVSHDLRTPLNSILGYTEMLLEDAVSDGDEQRSLDLQRIHDSGRDLLLLINDILDLSRAEVGKTELRPESFAVQDLVRDVTDSLRPLLEKGGNELTVSLAPDCGAMFADPARVHQCLFNLLSNSCKFTEQGKIQLSVTRIAAEHEERIRFVVTDSGIGIEPEQLERLFKAFSNREPTTQPAGAETGLGLSIASILCTTMGGELSATSRPGLGSRFVIELPVETTSIGEAV